MKAKKPDKPSYGFLKNHIKERQRIIDGISSWLKLLALIVLAVEAVLIVGIIRGGESDPLHSWYIPLMLLFFSIIVVGLFFDQYIRLRAGTFSNGSTVTKTASMEPDDFRVEDDTKASDRAEIPTEDAIIEVPHSGKVLQVRLAEDIAVVSPSLRKESMSKILHLLTSKLGVHRSIFEYPNPSAILPVNNRYFARFSWDNKMVVCHQIFEIPDDTDMKIWEHWTGLQALYVEAYASAHRQPHMDRSIVSMKKLAEKLEDIYEVAQDMIAANQELRSTGTQLLLTNLRGFLKNIDYEDKSQSLSSPVVKLENALSTSHDIIKRLMPRVIEL